MLTPEQWLTIGVAGYAAVVSTAALALEVRRWVEAGPRLHISIMPAGRKFGAGVEDDADYVVANVTNRGASPTTLTHFIFVDYEKSLNWWRGKQTWAAFVASPGWGGTALPKLLQPGEQWTGMARYDEDGDLARRRDRGFLYVEIYSAHADKAARARVRTPVAVPTSDRLEK